MLLGLERDVTEGIYWLNMKDPAPYGAVIAHTNFVPRERYPDHLVYLASYFHEKPPANHEERMLLDFCERFGVARDEVHWHEMAIEPCAGPLYTTGFERVIVPYKAGGLYFAGMFSRPNYPERSMDGAVAAGIEVADLVAKDSGA
jgi:protoporphyrinogen oxidase